MALLEIPNPVGIYESAKNAGLERDVANAFVSAMLSAAITLMWRTGSAKWIDWFGEGQALKDAATAMYLTLESQLKPGFLTLTVPQDMLDPANVSRFQTEFKEKKS